ncbi:MAG TPA: hypothetical protein EYP24_04780 [bacterium (Candidatus Stahlbacteria)]|nr:hypothetical protein [Candidatus Stahlbacteria bacterium]
MMKKLLILFILFGSSSGIGLGIIIGEPTGISLKNWIAEKHAIDFGIGWSFTRNRIHIIGDYLFHFPEWVEEENWYPYLGIGGRLKLKEEQDEWRFNLGVRFGIGIEYIYQRFGFFGELYPVMDLIPETDFDLEGGIGARFYLKR